jgi:MoaA/NifB/PqqE/SkfB family radical SAM enzyme
MECAVIVTYRCNARCGMCQTWQHPSPRSEEIGPDVMARIPAGQKRINLTGGEPALRDDLPEIVAVLDGKTDRLEISTNGYLTDRLVTIGKRFPHVTFRISVEGLPETNDRLRGLKDGFDHALRTVLRLREAGVRDVGFGIVISDRNKDDLLDLYHLCVAMDIEFASSTMHNSFYFHTAENRIEDRDGTVLAMRRFIEELLRSKRWPLRARVKDWGRAYINVGILRHIQGSPRALPCGAGSDLFFLDPWGRVLACNGSEEPWVMGDLTKQDFAAIWGSAEADAARRRARECSRNCWMVGTAVPAMRRQPAKPLGWILRNKLRLAVGRGVVFDRAVAP